MSSVWATAPDNAEPFSGVQDGVDEVSLFVLLMPIGRRFRCYDVFRMGGR